MLIVIRALIYRNLFHLNLNEFALMCLQTKRSILLRFGSLGLAQEQSPATPLAMKKQDDKCLKFMKSNWLTLATLAGVLVGKFSPNPNLQ